MQIYRYPLALVSMALAVGTVVVLATPSWAQVLRFHYLNNVQGDVRVGQFMINPDPAMEGMPLPSSHHIRLGGNSWVTLNCSNRTRHRFSRPGTYAVSDYCPGDVARRNNPRNLPRDPFNVALPYVLSPRNTALMNPENLAIEWNPMLGATSYRVQIGGRGVNWAIEVDEPRTIFPNTASLQPNYRYTVVITTDNGPSSRNGSPVGFTILPTAEVERVNKAVEQIQVQGLEPDIEVIALAMLYLDYEHSDSGWRSYALIQPALEVLAARIEMGTKNPAIYQLQAEAYLGGGLPLLARRSYEQALALAQAAGQQEIQAQIQIGLGKIAYGQTEYRGAIRHWQEAQRLYRRLGDEAEVEETQRQIEAALAQVNSAVR